MQITMHILIFFFLHGFLSRLRFCLIFSKLNSISTSNNAHSARSVHTVCEIAIFLTFPMFALNLNSWFVTVSTLLYHKIWILFSYHFLFSVEIAEWYTTNGDGDGDGVLVKTSETEYDRWALGNELKTWRSSGFKNFKRICKNGIK